MVTYLMKDKVYPVFFLSDTGSKHDKTVDLSPLLLKAIDSIETAYWMLQSYLEHLYDTNATEEEKEDNDTG